MYRYLILFLLFICTCESVGQNLKLKVYGEDDARTGIIDSISYSNRFENFKALKSEIDLLTRALWRKGYIDTVSDSLIKTNDSLFEAYLTLGKPLKRIRVHHDSDFNTLLLAFVNHEKGDTYFDLNIADLENALNILNAKIAEEGDPFSTLQLVNLQKLNSAMITSTLKIKRNQKRKIDKIIVKGYEKFSKSFIKRFLKLQTGKSFNLNEIKTKVELLEELRFAGKIRDPEVLFTSDSTTLYLYIEKTKTNNFDGFLGFGTNETTNKLDFDGYLDLRLINNLNYGETLNLFYKSDEIDQQTFRVDTDLPYLFGSPVGLQLGLNIFRKDSTFSNASQYARINYQINAKHKVGAGIQLTNSTNLLEADSSILNDYTSNFYTINYNFVQSQFYDPLFPINFLIDLSAGTGTRENDNGSLNQNVVRLDAFKIFNLNKRNSIFLRGTGAVLTSDDYLDNELFRFGGINSIRGFEENSLVANMFGVLNTEYRYRLSSSIYVHSVLDAAYFENQLTDAKEKLFGFGFGFGLLTNAGLFRLNYSSGKTEDRQFRLSDSKVHLSLTATF